jgi:hypothetical protein
LAPRSNISTARSWDGGGGGAAGFRAFDCGGAADGFEGGVPAGVPGRVAVRAGRGAAAFAACFGFLTTFGFLTIFGFLTTFGFEGALAADLFLATGLDELLRRGLGMSTSSKRRRPGNAGERRG